MPKPKIEEYNYFICPKCDPDGITKLSPQEFQKHLPEVHGIKTTKGTRTMLSHLDARGWFVWNWQWTIAGETFTQHTKQARSREFGNFDGFEEGESDGSH
jgi:hypothetical protein